MQQKYPFAVATDGDFASTDSDSVRKMLFNQESKALFFTMVCFKGERNVSYVDPPTSLIRQGQILSLSILKEESQAF